MYDFVVRIEMAKKNEECDVQSAKCSGFWVFGKERESAGRSVGGSFVAGWRETFEVGIKQLD